MKKTLLTILIPFILTGCVAIEKELENLNNTVKDMSKKTPSSARHANAVPYTNEICQAYRRNPVSADKKYLNTVIKVTGEIISIKDITRSISNYSVTIKSNVDGNLISLENYDGNLIETLAVGQEITHTGTLFAMTESIGPDECFFIVVLE